MANVFLANYEVRHKVDLAGYPDSLIHFFSTMSTIHYSTQLMLDSSELLTI